MSLGHNAVLRARAHPVRLQMLSLLTGTAMSAAELGRELGISHALASYHLRFLVDAGTVQFVEQTSNRGGKERRYRYLAEAPGQSHPESYQLEVAAAAEELRRRAPERDPEGPGVLVDAELWVTAEQWLAFRDTVRDAAVTLHNQAVKPRTPGTRPVSVTAVLFEMAAKP